MLARVVGHLLPMIAPSGRGGSVTAPPPGQGHHNPLEGSDACRNHQYRLDVLRSPDAVAWIGCRSPREPQHDLGGDRVVGVGLGASPLTRIAIDMRAAELGKLPYILPYTLTYAQDKRLPPR